MTADHSPRALLRRGARNFSWNLAGVAVPTAFALMCLPATTERLGAERLGALGLVWAVIGYFGLFDLGMARVLTRHLAAAGNATERDRAQHWARQLNWALAGATALFALVIAIAVWGLGLADAPVGGLPAGEVQATVWIVLATLPSVAATGVLRGVLEGRQQFAAATALRTVLAVWSFASPLATSFASNSLVWATCAIALGRYVGWLLHAKVAKLPKRAASTERLPWRLLFGEGGWVTLSGIVGPVMVSLDRFVVASFISLAATAYYVVPQEIVLRLVAVPAALATAVFPLMASGWADAQVSAFLWRKSLRATLALSLPMCAVLAAFAAPLLAAWMGSAFATASAAVAAILSVGLLFNCMAQTPLALIQAAGRADLAGKIHCAELLPFIFFLAWAAERWGILGAATVWTARAAVDCALMWWACARVRRISGAGRELLLLAAAGIAIAMIAAATIAAPENESRWLTAVPFAFALILAAGAARSAVQPAN